MRNNLEPPKGQRPLSLKKMLRLLDKMETSVNKLALKSEALEFHTKLYLNG